MAIVSTLVAKSHGVHDAALNLNAKAFELRQTLAGVWDLKPATTEAPDPTSTFHLDMKNDSGESVVGDEDERVKVEAVHFAPGGKYRCMSSGSERFLLLMVAYSYCEALHSLRVPRFGKMGYGNWLAYQA